MTYRKGDLQITVPPIHPDCDEEGWCWHCDGMGTIPKTLHGVVDTREDYEIVHGAYLPRSCDEWVIGGPKEIDALIEDLRAARDLLLEEREKISGGGIDGTPDDHR